MNNIKIQLKKLSSTLCLFLALIAVTSAKDIPGGSDHPLISRYPASTIIFNEVSEFNEYRIPLSKPYRESSRVYAADKNLTLQGKITRLVYASNPEASDLQIHENYIAAFSKPNFSVVRNCKGASCEVNAKTFARYLQQERVSYRDKAQAFFVAAKYNIEGSAPVYFVVLNGTTNRGNSHIIVDIIETKSIELGKITTNADVLLESLTNHGKAAIYDIFFDTGKSVVKSTSKAALESISQVLSAKPELQLYIVGHTDDTGAVAANVKLANERANAIVEYLSVEFGVSKSRLYPAGAGPFAPVASNDSVQGRAKNRRVEIVKRLRD